MPRLLSVLPLLLAPCLAIAADDVRGDNPDSLPSTPEEERAKFHLPPGFEIQLVAAEPDIQKPINITFDGAGRLWVTGSEMYPWPAGTDAAGQTIPGYEKAFADIASAFHVGNKAPQPSFEARDTVRVLSDFDETGRAKTIRVFADGLNIPSGVQPLPRGSAAIARAYGLLPNFDPNPAMMKRAPLGDRHIGQAPKGDSAIVYSIPNIWLLTDWDGDGFAESRVPLYATAGYLDTHGGMSSFLYWTDGWIYGTHGFRNHSELHDRDGRVTVLDSGNTYRFRPDGSAFEIFTHGQTNPFGLAFDPLGNFYSADSHSKPVYMLQRGGYYEGIGKQHDGLGFAPHITEDGHGSTAIAGVAYYADNQFPEEYRGDVFIGNVVTRRVHHDKLVWHGSTPEAVRQPDFLTSDDPWFRPVQTKLGPDGALWIADFYNSIIGHYEFPLADPRRDHSHGRIWRVVYRGEKKDAPVAAPPDLVRLNSTELIDKLGDSNLEVRRLATNELADRIGARAESEVANQFLKTIPLALFNTESGPVTLDPGATSQLIAEQSVLERIKPGFAAAWFLNPHLSPAENAETLLRMPDAFVSRSLQWFGELSESGVPGLTLTEQRVALGKQDRPILQRNAARAISATAEALRNAAPLDSVPDDSSAPDAAKHRQHDAELRQQAIDDMPQVLNVILEALDHPAKDDTELTYALRMALRDCLLLPDSYPAASHLAEENAAAADRIADVSVAARTPEAAEFLVGYLQRNKLATPRAGEYLKHVALYLPAEKFGRVSELITRIHDAPLLQRLVAADGLSQAARQRGIALPDETTAWARQVMIESLGSSNDFMLKAAIESVREAKFDAKLEPLAKIANNPKRTESQRIAALEALANLDAARPILGQALASPAGMKLRKRAAELLGQSNTDEARAALLAALPTAPAEVGAFIAAGLAATDPGAEALITTMENGKAAPVLLRNSVVAAALEKRPPALRERVTALTKDLPPEDERLDKVIALRAAAFQKAKPDVAHGAQVFQQNCAVCHKLGNQGANIGPALDGIGARGVPRVIEDILDPNRNVDPIFRQTIVETSDGQTLAGLNAHVEGELLVLTDATGKQVSVPRANVKTQTQSKLSLMPPIFETTIAPGDFNDLLGFLWLPRSSRESIRQFVYWETPKRVAMPANLYTFFERGIAQTRKYGFRLLRYRYVTRPRILRTAPVPCPEDAPLEVHTMVCRRDWLNWVWSLKSFRAAAALPFRLVVFHDGSLQAEDLAHLRRLFPGVHIPSQDSLRSAAEQRLGTVAPSVLKLWQSGDCFILRKVVDSWLSAKQRWVLKIDPDVLFFQRPDELLDPGATLAGRYAAFNAQQATAHREGMYCLNPEHLRAQFGIDLPFGFNDGLGVVDTSLVDWQLIEQIFAAVPVMPEFLFLAAQTMEAIFCRRYGYLALPADRYQVEHADCAVDEFTVARHYLAKTRDRLYVEGIPRLLSSERARRFVA